MSKLFRMTVVITLCVIGFTGVATAQNINWNQANHGICGDLQSATPGLFGLCVAFCEAHGCEPDLTAANPFADCKPSDPKLLDLYNGLKQTTDPDMPCVVVEPEEGCPCFTQEQVDAIPTPYAQCAIDSGLGLINPGELYTNIVDDLGAGAGTAIGEFNSNCGYFNGFVDPPISVSLQTSAAQAQECRQIIVNTITANANQCELLCDPVCEP